MSALLTIVLPYFNERGFIAATLASLAAQSDRRFRLVLVDNASTDGSEALARESWAGVDDVEAVFASEAQPGKLFALQSGLALVETRYLATADADTIYPRDYVRRILREFARNADAVAVLAFNGANGRNGAASLRDRVFAAIFPGKCHTGGFGQAFRTEALRAAGGFDPQIWRYVLEDHEIIHRLRPQGRLAYAADHDCLPSDRRGDRSDCNWSLGERILYKLLPQRAMDWFFYRFLAPRFARRGLETIRLRSGEWREDQAAR